MRKLLILLLFLPIGLYGQVPLVKTSVSYAQPVAAVYPEMLTDVTFPDATNWTIVTTGWTITGTSADYDDVVFPAKLIQIDEDMVSSITTETDYTISFDLTIAGANRARISFYNFSTTRLYKADAWYTGSGTHSADFTSPATLDGGGFCIYPSTNSDDSWSITNISLKLR